MLDKTVEIKLPRSVDDLRIRHFKILENPLYHDIKDENLLIDFLYDYTGVKKGILKQIYPEDIGVMYKKIVSAYAGYKPKTPPKEVTINGKEYYMIDPRKVGIGWHIDYGNTDTKRDRVRTACLFYHPKGYTYGDVDANDNLINPIADRFDEFNEHFPLSLYMDVSAFFLNNYQRSIATSILMIRMLKIKAWFVRLVSLNGRKSST